MASVSTAYCPMNATFRGPFLMAVFEAFGVTIMYVSGINAQCAAGGCDAKRKGVKLMRINWPINIGWKMFLRCA